MTQSIFTDSTSNITTNTVTIFHNDEFGQVRTIDINGEPWFIGKDVAENLGYTDTNYAIRTHVDEEDKMATLVNLVGQNRSMVIINESGLYTLILRSNLEKSKDFKRWITSAVIPSIRNHGLYAADELLKNPEMLMEVAKKLQAERHERLIAEKQRNLLIHQDKLFTTTEIAKEISFTSALKLNILLEEMQIQYKCNDSWVPTSKYAPLGYTSLKQSILDDGKVVYNRMWTAKGREFLLNKFREIGLVN